MKGLCIIGPTASGKTSAAVQAALLLNGEVVSCDSVQIYRGFDIGTAKPTLDERMGVPHHMLDVAEPDEVWSAGRYARAARNCVSDILSRSKLPILAGGTGLYLRALCEGLAELPDCPRLDHGCNAYERLLAVDPVTAARLHPNDKKRVFRALDVYCATGKTISQFHEEPCGVTNMEWLTIGINPPRDTLLERIALRAGAMLQCGLIEETSSLLDSGVSAECPPMNAIGYVQARAVISGLMTVPEARENIILRTRQYAKRQRTWFLRQTEALWVDNITTKEIKRLENDLNM